MTIEICTIGGYSETGKNSTAIKVDDEVIILDMGLHMENYIRYTEDEDISAMHYQELLDVNAVPNYGLIEDWRDKIIGIVPSHGHLDHIGAIPFSAPLFPQAPIVCSPYTAEVLKSIFTDEKIRIPNELVALNLNSKYKLSNKVQVELVNITHSIPQAAMIVLHTPYGKIVYANDYKFDRQPTLGKKPNFERLKQIGEIGVKLLIVESLYAHEQKKMPSESVAKQMLKDVMLGVQADDKAIIVTTFSSHLARLKSIVEMGKKLNRKIVFCGRSLAKYVSAGQRINIIDFEKEVLGDQERGYDVGTSLDTLSFQKDSLQIDLDFFIHMKDVYIRKLYGDLYKYCDAIIENALAIENIDPNTTKEQVKKRKFRNMISYPPPLISNPKAFDSEGNRDETQPEQI